MELTDKEIKFLIDILDNITFKIDGKDGFIMANGLYDKLKKEGADNGDAKTL